MSRQSITFTEKNNVWLKAQVDSKEYSSISEIINYLIRKERGQEKDWIKSKLTKVEQSGFTKDSQKQILALSKKMLKNK